MSFGTVIILLIIAWRVARPLLRQRSERQSDQSRDVDAPETSMNRPGERAGYDTVREPLAAPRSPIETGRHVRFERDPRGPFL